MKKEPKKLGRIHFVGIGGIGMSGIAELMHKSGYFVQGSDININSNVRRLKSKGVKIFYKHNNKNISNATVVVFSSAIKKNNPEIVEALKRRIPLVSRAEMLGELMKFKRGIAIAGSHGKTTTTSILGGILEEASLDPTIVNGGIINSLHSNSRMGKGEWMVVEADESDGSFLYLPNEINIITNIDFEHLDYYNKFENLYDSFKKFSSQIPFYGSTIICLEDKNTKKLSTEINRREVITYGIKKKESDLNIKSILLNKKQSIFEISLSKKFQSKNKKRITFNLNLLGNHNVLNATAAIAASLKIGIKIS
ncbi:MAG: UDP-N-acetylmuramate--L-alanine ligase, partial [Alphaproteobacteria bacterium MarineAlpha5_Bin11]